MWNIIIYSIKIQSRWITIDYVHPIIGNPYQDPPLKEKKETAQGSFIFVLYVVYVLPYITLNVSLRIYCLYNDLNCSKNKAFHDYIYLLIDKLINFHAVLFSNIPGLQAEERLQPKKEDFLTLYQRRLALEKRIAICFRYSIHYSASCTASYSCDHIQV